MRDRQMRCMMGELPPAKESQASPLQDEKIVLRKISAPFYWIPKALLDAVKPSQQGLMAYNALMYYAIDGRSQNVGIAQLAKKVGCSPDTMRRGLKDLVAKNALKVRERKVKKNGKLMVLPNEYTLVDLADRKSSI